mmetsp:Transcript_122400/g.273425  ORF Transcript_122400/g.273425 Transcript_122400/m.273425 type:complete len:170 (-) Transcript_122400:328-837(-)
MGKKTKLPRGSSHAEMAQHIERELGIPASEQILLQHAGGLQGHGFNYRVERKMNVDQLFFTHDTIRSNFGDGRSLFQLINDMTSGDVDPLLDLEPLRVVWHEGKWRSLSNRRLWALKSYSSCAGHAIWTRVQTQDADAEFRKKNTTRNDGMSVQITARSRTPSPASPQR